MSGYLPTIRYETKFEDDAVVFALQPLSKGAFISVMPHIHDAQQNPNDESVGMKVYNAACEVLASHIVSIEGLKDSNGNAITKEEFLDKIYFLNLVTSVFNKMVQEASLGKLPKAG